MFLFYIKSVAGYVTSVKNNKKECERRKDIQAK